MKRWATRLAIAAAVVVAFGYALSAFAAIMTSWWWYDSVGHASVYATEFRAQAVLFAIAGVTTAAALWLGLRHVYRHRPAWSPDRERHPVWAAFLGLPARVHQVLLGLVVVVLTVRAGRGATGSWQTYVLWRNAKSWGRTDPQFHRDISYYVGQYPFERLLLGFGTRALSLTIAVVLIVGVLVGAVTVRRWLPRATPELTGLLSILAGLYLFCRAGGYWLDRYAIAFAGDGPLTGPSYTDVHAVLPGRTVLSLVTLAAAGVLLVNARQRRVRTLVGAVAAVAVVSYLSGSVVPMLVQRFRAQPSQEALEAPYIARNIAATRDAYGIADVGITKPAGHLLEGRALNRQAGRTAQIRLLDPNVLSPTFTVKRQLESYYGFERTLDIDRYRINGRLCDVAIAPRELNLGGVASRTWVNSHMVYTHGYGVVAAETDAFDTTTGIPRFREGGLPPDQLGVDRPQIYFGQSASGYAIVGAAPGSDRDLEFDHPSTDGSNHGVTTTYDGGAGVPVGSVFRRVLEAVRLGSPNIMFSGEINDNSRLLSVRDPRSRVATLAPWLTVDGDPYIAIVDGHLVWLLDGYTTTNNYPEAQRVNLRSATANTLTQQGGTISLPGRSINYLRDSVKATVDAYTGEVHLYEWNQEAQPDPLLDSWEQAFPGLVEPESAIPADVLTHLRYPQDLFNLQRTMVTKYHVESAADFYGGSDFWLIPSDPTVAATNQLNAQGAPVPAAVPNLPSTYLTLAADGTSAPSYTLSSPLVTLNGRNLAAFMSVEAAPGPGYGRLTLQEFPAGEFEAPAQIQNDIESSNRISKALTLQRGGNSTVVLGNLLTIPLGGRMLSVEPVFTQAAGANSFPVLRHVIAVYGDGAPAFEPTLDRALLEALRAADRHPG